MGKIVYVVRVDTIKEWRSVLDYLISNGYSWSLAFEGSSKYEDEYFEDGARYIEVWDDGTFTKSILNFMKNILSFQELITEKNSEKTFYRLIATSGIISGSIISESDNVDELEKIGNRKIRVRRDYRLFDSWSVVNYKGDLISRSL